MTRSPAAIREDFRAIANLVRDGAKVLDVGCGTGELLQLLRDEKGVDGRGLEISSDGVSACLAKGLAVIQGDADRDLADYPPLRFDYAILSQTLQATHAPKEVLTHLLRLADALTAAQDVRFCVLSFTSDWLYPTAESRRIVRALNAAGAQASFVEIPSDKGHDAFLLDEPVMREVLDGFLASAAKARGL